MRPPEDGAVAGQALALVEADAVKIGVMLAGDERAAADALGRLGAVAKLGGQRRCGAVGAHQQSPLHCLPVLGRDGPQARIGIELGASHIEALLEMGSCGTGEGLGDGRQADRRV